MTSSSTSRAPRRRSSRRPTPMIDRPCREVTVLRRTAGRGRRRPSVGDGRQERAPARSVASRSPDDRRDRTDAPLRRRVQSSRSAGGSGPVPDRASICRSSRTRSAPGSVTGRRPRPRSRRVDAEILEQVSGDGYPVRRLPYAPYLYQHRRHRAHADSAQRPLRAERLAFEPAARPRPAWTANTSRART